MSNIDTLPKGALIDKPDSRDFTAKPTLMGAAPVDWQTGYTVPEDMPVNDQGSSSSCVAQAWSYYHGWLKSKEFSRHDLYARIFQPQGGAYIRDGGVQITTIGQSLRDVDPDPFPETEPTMRVPGSVSAEKLNIESQSFSLPNDIDSVAQGIKTFGGVVFGVTGTNEGWQDMSNPRPPASGETQWGHALYCKGYHLHDGLKCIIAKSSWEEVPNHHIKENYFAAGYTFNPWTLIPKQQGDTMIVYKFDDNATEYVLCEDTLIPFTDMDTLAQFTSGRTISNVVLPAAVRPSYNISTVFLKH